MGILIVRRGQYKETQSEAKAQARANGSAVGSAFLYPVSISRIAAWAKGLQSRGFVLVPASAIVTAPKS